MRLRNSSRCDEGWFGADWACLHRSKHDTTDDNRLIFDDLSITTACTPIHIDVAPSHNRHLQCDSFSLPHARDGCLRQANCRLPVGPTNVANDRRRLPTDPGGTLTDRHALPRRQGDRRSNDYHFRPLSSSRLSWSLSNCRGSHTTSDYRVRQSRAPTAAHWGRRPHRRRRGTGRGERHAKPS